MQLLKLLVIFLSIFLSQSVFANSEINPYRIIIKLRNMPEIADLSAVKPHIRDLENIINLKISTVKPMSGGNYILIFDPEEIQQLAKKTNTENDIAFNNLIKLLAAKSNIVEYAVLDRIITLDPKEIDHPKTTAINLTVKPTHDKQWDEKNPANSTPANPSWGVNLEQAWNVTKGNDVVVAVIDTGIANNTSINANTYNRTLPDERVITYGYNFYANTTNVTDNGIDTGYHGTHVAGTIAANTSDPNQGIYGMAPNAKIVPILALQPSGSDSSIINSMYWASGISVPGVDDNIHPAKVLNLSLGAANPCSQAYKDAINAIRAKGVTIVVAAGNENLDASTSSPANCPGVITVAATNDNGARSPYSNFGSLIALAAPGGMTPFSTTSVTGILSTILNDYAYYQGTSMATPHIAGIAALLYAVRGSKTTTPDQIKSWLTTTARAFPTSSNPDFNCLGTKSCGAGVVDAYQAVLAAQKAQ